MTKSKARTIVVADFDPKDTEALRAILASKGHRVSAARDGAAVLDLVRSEDPDLLVLNGVLRGRSGFAICHEIASRPEGGPAVILLLDTDDTYVCGLARACGAREAHVKPVDPDTLLASAERRPPPRPDVTALLAEREEKIRSGEIETEPIAALREFEGNFLEGLIDPHLGVFNRTYCTVRLLEEFKKTRRYGTPLVVAVLLLHDPIGGRGADEAASDAMAQAASTLLVESRESDVTGLLDERRFLLLLTNTGIPGATVMMRRVLAALRRSIPDGPRFHAGLGIAPHPDHVRPEDLLDAAARAAAQAAEEGRDFVEVP